VSIQARLRRRDMSKPVQPFPLDLLTDEQVMEALVKRGYKVHQIIEWFQRKGLM
jgi:hypothetical protein